MNQTPHLETLRDLLHQASDEINMYRARQFTTFREIVIVQGLIAWAFTRLRLDPGFGAQVVRYAAIVACIAAAWIGMWIMSSYRKRIHHMRNSRDTLTARILSVDPALTNHQLFYPTDPTKTTEEYRTRRTSIIYSVMMGIVGAVTSVIIFFVVTGTGNGSK